MSTNAKIGIAVALLVVMVFGVTIVSQLPKGETPSGDGDGGEVEDGPKNGLVYAINHLKYDPNDERVAIREYQQFFEVGEHMVPFWVSNPNTVPIQVSFEYTSCGACSFADLAIVPAPPIDGGKLANPLGAVLGGHGPRAAEMADYRARRRVIDNLPAADWQRLKAANSTRADVTGFVDAVTVPAAESPDRPTWAVIKLNVSVTQKKTLETVFACQRPDSPAPIPMTLKADVEPYEPCGVSPSFVDFGNVPESAGVIERTVYFWSATRPLIPTPDSLLPPLPPPAIPGNGSGSGHVTFTDPVPVSAEELASMAAQLTETSKTPIRVAGAYKLTLQFRRKITADGKTTEVDLGPYDRTIGLVPDGGGIQLNKTPTVTVRANVIGAVRLEPGKYVKDDKINLGSFPTNSGLDREVTVVSDTPGLELEAVPDECRPFYLRLDPDLAPQTKNGRTRWTLRLKIDPGAGGGEMKPGSVIVLRIKSTGQLVRIPVVGRGTT